MTFFESLLEKHDPSWDGHINEAGLEIVRRFESWVSAPYRCPAGRWTIGYGATWDMEGNPVGPDHPALTKDEGELLLRKEIAHVEKAIRRLIKAELTPNMFSAICSWGFNVGTGAMQRSTLRMKLNRGQYEDAADELPRWKKAGGRTLKGLVRRRASERALFLAE